MRRFLLVGLCVLGTVLVFGVATTTDVHSQTGPCLQAAASSQGELVSQDEGTCGCPKYARFCCTDCAGNFAYCAPSPAYCPECPAP